MTNLQESQEERESGLVPAAMRRLWLWTPIAAGGALSLLLLGSVAVPQWMTISRDLERLNALEAKRQEVDLLKVQTLKVVKDRRKAEQQQAKLMELVAGNSDGATFLATLDLEARQTGVKLQLFEPTAAAPAEGTPEAGGTKGTAPAGGGGRAKESEPPPDPLEQAGLKKRALLLSARGTYPQLLAFMRRMELLDLLVEQKDLTVVVAGREPGRPDPGNDRELPPPVPEVEGKLGVTLYHKTGKTTKKPGSETGARTKGQAPAPPG